MTAMQIVQKIARRPESSDAARQSTAARDRALEARNQIIRGAIARLAPSAQAIVIDSYARAYPDDAS